MAAAVTSQDASLAASKLQEAFGEVVRGFSDRLQDLRHATRLRLDESAISLFSQDMADLQKSVHELEGRLRILKDSVAREKDALLKVDALMTDSTNQGLRLNFIADNLPSRLPQQPLPAETSAQQPIEAPPEPEAVLNALDLGPEAGTSLEHAGSGVLAEKRKKKLPHQAPRRYVSETEYAALSTYMTQRLPLSKVNTAVDEAADLAESNMKLLAQARSGGKMLTQEWKRAQSLLVNIASKDAVKGKCWLMDMDLRKGSVLKPDKTGKAIMTILRHLGRIHEARLALDGKLESVYTLSPESH